MGLSGWNPTRADHAFVLTPKNVIDLEAELARFFPQILFHALCADGVVRSFDSARKLCEYDNPLSRDIQAMGVQAADPAENRSYEAIFNKHEMTITVVAAEDVARKLITWSRGLLDGIRAPYAVMAQPFIVGLMSSFIGMVAVGGVRIGPAETIGLPEPTVRLGDRYPWTLVLVGAIVGVVAARLSARIYPNATFAIGFGETRHRNLESWRSQVVIGFVISFLASVAFVFFEFVWKRYY